MENLKSTQQPPPQYHHIHQNSFTIDIKQPYLQRQQQYAVKQSKVLPKLNQHRGRQLIKIKDKHGYLEDYSTQKLNRYNNDSHSINNEEQYHQPTTNNKQVNQQRLPTIFSPTQKLRKSKQFYKYIQEQMAIEYGVDISKGTVIKKQPTVAQGIQGLYKVASVPNILRRQSKNVLDQVPDIKTLLRKQYEKKAEHWSQERPKIVEQQKRMSSTKIDFKSTFKQNTYDSRNRDETPRIARSLQKNTIDDSRVNSLGDSRAFKNSFVRLKPLGNHQNSKSLVDLSMVMSSKIMPLSVKNQKQIFRRNKYLSSVSNSLVKE